MFRVTKKQIDKFTSLALSEDIKKLYELESKKARLKTELTNALDEVYSFANFLRDSGKAGTAIAVENMVINNPDVPAEIRNHLKHLSKKSERKIFTPKSSEKKPRKGDVVVIFRGRQLVGRPEKVIKIIYSELGETIPDRPPKQILIDLMKRGVITHLEVW